jgi:hypothetical protein
VVINEVLTHTDDPLEDAIELHNPTASPVNIGGWYLSDSQSDLETLSHSGWHDHSARWFAVFYQYQFGPPDGEADVPPLFSFNSAHGDSAYLVRSGCWAESHRLSHRHFLWRSGQWRFPRPLSNQRGRGFCCV